MVSKMALEGSTIAYNASARHALERPFLVCVACFLDALQGL